MPNPENIEPHKFKKGTTGNPNGRPKLPKLSDLMDKTLGEEKDGITAAEVILKKLRQMAAAGNLKAAEILLDRGYGKPKQTIDQTIIERPIFNGINLDVPTDDSASENSSVA